MLNIEKIKVVGKLLQVLLEPILASQCEVANYKNGCITLQAENAAIVTRLRYQIPELLEKLRRPEYLPGIASIKCIVRPNEQDIVENKARISASPAAADIVTDAAKNVNHAELQDALFKLSKTLKNN